MIFKSKKFSSTSIVVIIILFGALHAQAQAPFKYDSLYKTIYAKDFCALVQQHPDLLLIDVRSAGEYSDTSRDAGYNLGHLKGAINLEIEGIRKNIDTLAPYKNKTIVFYCSHSQRSRRVSRLLAEKGFTDFYNLNGGMSVLNQLSDNDFPCKKEWIVSNLPFKSLSFNETAKLIQTEKKLIVLDVRPASQFNSIDSLGENNVGYIKGAINIPFDELPRRINELQNNKLQPILVYATSGDGGAASAAALLENNHFKLVYQMIGGINDFVASREDVSIIQNSTPYVLIDPYMALRLLQKPGSVAVYDTRSDDEYNNKLTGNISYRNLGHIINAVHIQEQEFNLPSLPPDKNKPVLIYGNNEAFNLAKLLLSNGYKQVYVLNSLYDFVWSAFNVERCKAAKTFLVDHEGLY